MLALKCFGMYECSVDDGLLDSCVIGWTVVSMDG